MSDDHPPPPEELSFLTDQELLTEWMKTKWEEGDARMEVLAAEVERRGLDFSWLSSRVIKRFHKRQSSGRIKEAART